MKGVVFEDVNGEPGIRNVDVVIFDSSGGSQTVTTDRDGNYEAIVAAGPVVLDIVEDTLLPGAKQTAGNDPTRVEGGTATDANGFQFPPPPTPKQIELSSLPSVRVILVFGELHYQDFYYPIKFTKPCI